MKNKNEELWKIADISDKRLSREITIGTVLFVVGFLVADSYMPYFDAQTWRTIGFVLAGSSCLTSANAITVMMNSTRPQFLSFIKFGPAYSRFIGIITIVFALINQLIYCWK